MTKKDYILLAEALRSSAPASKKNYSQWVAAVQSITRALATDNPRFNADKFIRACGVHE